MKLLAWGLIIDNKILDESSSSEAEVQNNNKDHINEKANIILIIYKFIGKYIVNNIINLNYMV